MFLDLPLLARLPLQTIVWCWVVLLPGVVLAAAFLQRKRTSIATVGALTIGFGLAAVPALVHLYVLFTAQPTNIWALLLAATAINLFGLWKWRGGLRLAVDGQGPVLWLGVIAVLLATFVTSDGTYPVMAADEWKLSGTTQCFMEGTYKYMGVETPARGEFEYAPTSGGAFITFGNVALSATHMVIFGAPGLRILRCLIGLLFGLLGWIIWRQVGGKRGAAIIGLAVFALNPYLLTSHDLDRNILALVYAAFLYVLTEKLRAGPIVVGLVAGFTIGLGLNLVPVLFLLPLAAHFWLRRDKHRRRNVGLLLGTAAVVGATWAVLFLPYVLGMLKTGRSHVEPWSYHLLGIEMQSRYLIGFPFANPLVRGSQNAFPPFLHFPLHIYASFGAVFVSFAVVGFGRSWSKSVSKTLQLLAWGLPIYLLVSTMAVFADYLQTRLIFAAMLPVLVFLLKGVADVLARPKLGVVVAVIACLLAGGGVAASHMEIPADQRLQDPRLSAYWTTISANQFVESDKVRKQREAYATPKLLPNYAGDPGLRNVISAQMPADYADYADKVTFYSDLQEPDVITRAPPTSQNLVVTPRYVFKRRKQVAGKAAFAPKPAVAETFVRVEPGSFQMGSAPNEYGRGDDETQHEVAITRPLLVQSTEVTQGQYKALMGNNPSHAPKCGDGCPVNHVSWSDAARYANARSRKDGLEQCYVVTENSVSWPKGSDCLGFRLPTEAEWERAAKSRVKGLSAMLGGVWEWCWDRYGDYTPGKAKDPLGPAAGSEHVARGMWGYSSHQIRASCRRCWAPETRYRELGFRLVRGLQR